MRKVDGMKEKNICFQYLKALLILMVIDDHVGSRIGLFTNIFPYNSFYMPFFVIISGYFYKKRPVVENLKKRTLRLLVPYILWSLVCNLLAYILYLAEKVNWYDPITPRSIVRLMIFRPLSELAEPGWFVIMLFYVAVCYNLLRVIVNKESILVDTLILVACLCAGCVALVVSMGGYAYDRPVLIAILRFFFYLQFYHVGVMFRNYGEVAIKKCNGIVICILCVAFNATLIYLLKLDINFLSTEGMRFFNSWYLPVITSITGGLFWYEVIGFISSKLGDIKPISFLADNTFTIMFIHMVFINIPNFYVYHQVENGNNAFADFDVNTFLSTAWYRYNADVRLVAFICGVVGSVAVAYCVSRVKK